MSDTVWRDVAANESPKIVELRQLARRSHAELDQVIGTRFGEMIARHQMVITRQGWIVFDRAPEGCISLDELPFKESVRLFVENIKTPRAADDATLEEILDSIRSILVEEGY